MYLPKGVSLGSYSMKQTNKQMTMTTNAHDVMKVYFVPITLVY